MTAPGADANVESPHAPGTASASSSRDASALDERAAVSSREPGVARAHGDVALAPKPTVAHADDDATPADVERAKETIAAEAPRRLRMNELLLELGALEEETTDARDHSLTVGELVDKAAEAGFGFLVGILTLIAIPFFGLSTPFGLAIALIGAQMMVGRQHPWLPRRARRRALSMSMLDRVATMLFRRTRWLVKMTRRRGEVLVAPRPIGLGITLLALGLALPLPIPGSNLVFLIPIFIYAVGLLERDGVWVAIGHVCLLVDVALMFAFGATIVAVLETIAGWFT